MGLASAMSTALTGLSAAETTIDVVGNNLANSNTVGFKASEAAFATQFLQTQSLGSSPTDGNGGTNPRQVGLGTLVGEIAPDFTQGTIEISSSPTDMAVQGDGFFIVQGTQGERLFTRNGIFKLNAESELTTITGNRVLGFGVDQDFQIQTTDLVPIEIPLGAAAVAKPTENVFLEGTLSPTGDLADQAQVIQSGVLSSSEWSYPAAGPTVQLAQQPGTAGVNTTIGGGGGMTPNSTYHYKFVFADGAQGAANATEGIASDPITVNLGAGENEVTLDTFPDPAPSTYSHVRVYRTVAGAAPTDTYHYVDEWTGAFPGGSINDVTADGGLGPVLDESSALTGSYEYYVTFHDSATGRESRPSPITSPQIVNNGRIHLQDIPADASGDYDETRIYRNTATDNSTFYRVTTLNTVAGGTYTDSVADSTIEGNPEIDLDGPKIASSTLLLDITQRDGSTYLPVFDSVGTLQFVGRKGDRSLAMKEFEVTATTTVLDFYEFMEDAMGIQEVPGPDPGNPIPPSGGTYGGNPGGSVTSSGQIRMTGNNGEANAIDIGLSGLTLVKADGSTSNINMPFTSIQDAEGESAVADFIAYDTLGIPLSVRITTVLESRNSNETTYRWFADSPDNDPDTGSEIAVGTGLIKFDGEGNFTTATEETVSILRRNVSSASPLEFSLDFDQISGLATENSTLAVSRQDGSAPGVLTSFIVGEDGRIAGVFSNGITRDLAQLRLARFGNPSGLEQKGENMFATGVNSGLPVEGNPNEQGIGSIIAGAQELSNTDIGGNLIDLILASTMYRGNTRVITTSQEMFDELLALRR